MKVFVLVVALVGLINADSCLTPEQDQQVQEIINEITLGLNTLSDALRFAGVVTHNQQLVDAADDIDKINKDVVADLQHIIDEACGTCSQITQCVTDAVHDLETFDR
eukprot:UN10577